MNREARRPPAPWLARQVFGGILLLLYLPLIYVVIGAFGNQDQTFYWFQQVLQDGSILEALTNSVLVALVASCGAVLLGTGAAIALSQSQFCGRKLLQSLSYASLVLPEIVFALSLLAWFFVLGISLSLATVIIAHITFSISYVILTVGARVAGLDPLLEDAARDLGASEWQIVWKVILPNLAPAVLAGFLLCFLLSFDDFLITFFVNGAGSDTLPIKLYGLMKVGVTPKLNALATLMWVLTSSILFVSFRWTSFRRAIRADLGHQ